MTLLHASDTPPTRHEAARAPPKQAILDIPVDCTYSGLAAI